MGHSLFTEDWTTKSCSTQYLPWMFLIFTDNRHVVKNVKGKLGTKATSFMS